MALSCSSGESTLSRALWWCRMRHKQAVSAPQAEQRAPLSTNKTVKQRGCEATLSKQETLRTLRALR